MIRQPLLAGAVAAVAMSFASPLWAGGEKHVMLTPGDVTYSPGPPSLAEGSEFAVLHGDPTGEGLFGMRLRLPDGFHIAPHFHSQPENVTVLSGTFHIGQGEQAAREATTALEEGSFFSFPPGAPHYAWAEGETVLQLNSSAPWTIEYVNPEDDPRKD